MDHLTDSTPGRRRARELVPGLLGVLRPGRYNAITDVPSVRVGHVTLREGADVRTGVTAVLPHGGNLYRERVPAGLSVANGFGKLIGATQVQELGELETPLLLTNTLAAPSAAAALVRWVLDYPGNEGVTTINPFVGECNDSRLNDIRRQSITEQHVRSALAAAAPGPVAEGAVGAGTGTVAFGFKGGIGTSSRVLPGVDGYTVGALVQSNFGGVLSFAGLPVGLSLRAGLPLFDTAGSIMMVLATDAPLSDRNLRRLAFRAHAGLARTGASFSNGSGDYALAFSVASEVRRTSGSVTQPEEVPNEQMSALFLAAIEAVEEAILNSLSMAADTSGYGGALVRALPLASVEELFARAAPRR